MEEDAIVSCHLYITHLCNDIYWWRSVYYIIKNILHTEEEPHQESKRVYM